MSIRRRRHGYEARVEYRETFDSREEAERAERVARSAVARARSSLAWGVQPCVTLLGGLPRFLRYQRLTKRNDLSTIAQHGRALRRFAAGLSRGQDGDVALDAIDAEELERVLGQLGERLSPGTVGKYLGSLKAFCAWAQRSKLVPPDAPLHWMAVEKPRALRRQRRIPSIEEFADLMEAWPEEGRHVARVILAVVLSGARPGALLEATGLDLSWPTPEERGRLRLRALKGGRLEAISFGEGDSLHRLLRAACAHTAAALGVRKHRRADPVFATSRGRRWTTTSFCRAVRHHADSTGGPRFVSYLSRHSALTWLAAAGVGDDPRRNYAGHTTTAMQSVYVHTSGEDGRSAREALSGLIGRRLSGLLG